MYNKKHRSAQRRFTRVTDFLTTNPVEGTEMTLQVLQDVVHDLNASSEQQDASTRLTRGETARQRALRNALWDQHMVRVSQIARQAFDIPGMDEKFALPAKRSDNEAILSSARGMLQAAEAHAEVFVQQVGLPARSFQEFRSAIEALAGALPTRVDGQNRKKKSKEAIEELVKRGVSAVQVLDAIVRPSLASKPDLLATWKSVKRPKEPGGNPGVAAEPDITPVVKAA